MLTEILKLTDGSELVDEDPVTSCLLDGLPDDEFAPVPYWRASRRFQIEFQNRLGRLDAIPEEIAEGINAVVHLLESRPDDVRIVAPQVVAGMTCVDREVYAALALATLSSAGLLRRMYAVTDKSGAILGLDLFASAEAIPESLEDAVFGTFRVSDGFIIDVYERIY